MSYTTVIDTVSVDTNILVYAFDYRNLQKHALSAGIVGRLTRANGILPLQCLTEFYGVTTRKQLLSATASMQIVREIAVSTTRTIPIIAADLLDAMHLHQRHHLQFFDCLMIATARRAGCRTFLTEDMQDGLSLDGITLVNPFLLSTAKLDELLS